MPRNSSRILRRSEAGLRPRVTPSHEYSPETFVSLSTSQRSGLSGGAREAVRLSMRAAELARHDSSPQLHALLAAREAIAHAAVGDSQGFRGSISRAWREVDRGFTDDAPAWLRFVTSSEITVHEAKGHLYLGDHLSASRLYRASLDATLGSRNCANYRAQLAAALAASGDVSGAVAEAMIVLPALGTGHIISLRTLAELEPVRRVAAQDPGGDEFCAYYDQARNLSA